MILESQVPWVTPSGLCVSRAIRLLSTSASFSSFLKPRRNQILFRRFLARLQVQLLQWRRTTVEVPWFKANVMDSSPFWRDVPDSGPSMTLSCLKMLFCNQSSTGNSKKNFRLGSSTVVKDDGNLHPRNRVVIHRSLVGAATVEFVASRFTVSVQWKKLLISHWSTRKRSSSVHRPEIIPTGRLVSNRFEHWSPKIVHLETELGLQTIKMCVLFTLFCNENSVVL